MKFINKYRNKKLFIKKAISLLPILVLSMAVFLLFIGMWNNDNSVPRGGIGWADQSLYTETVYRLRDGNLPTAQQLHYPIGYPVLGVIGSIVSFNDPFKFVSFFLLLSSIIFLFLGARKLYNSFWASFFIFLILVSDGVARSFNTSIELFAVPWSNQVLFCFFAFMFYILIAHSKIKPKLPLVVLVGFLAGYTVITREEAILFAIPLVIAWLKITKATFRQWVLIGAVFVAVILPYTLIKASVLGSATTSGHDAGYSQTAGRYLQPNQLYQNVWGVIIDSNKFLTTQPPEAIREWCNELPGACQPDSQREALLQYAPWLWLAPFGLGAILIDRKYKSGIKIFILISGFLLIFYLSGSNMSVHKLKYHCLRYISPSFIALNLGVVSVGNILFPQLSTKNNTKTKEKNQ